MSVAAAPGRVPTVLQFQAAECALAALAMLMAHHGCHVPLEELRQLSGVSADGSSLALLKRAAAHYGFATRAFRKAPEALAAVGFPCMAFVNFNHMLVVEAVTDDTLTVVDPASGRRRMDAAEFDRIYTGVVLRIEPTPALATRPRKRAQALPRLLRGGWAWWTAALMLAVAAGMGEAAAALALDGGNPVPALAVAAACAIASRLALRGGARALRKRAARLTGELLFSRCATFFACRSPALLMRTAMAPRELARLAADAPAPAIAALAGSLAPLAALAWLSPLAAAAVAVAWAVAALAAARTFLAAGAAWRQARHEGGRPDIAGKLHHPEIWQITSRDDDALTEMVGTVTRAMVPEQAFAQDEALLRAVLAAAVVGAVLAALATGPAWVAPALALLACRHWLKLPDILPPLFSLPMLAGLFDDLAAAPAAPTAAAEPPPGTAVELRGAAFAYGQNAILADLDLRIGLGARVGITGASGCGKSTLARLMAGVLPPLAGAVARPAKVALVPSPPILFEASIADNVACWRPGIDGDRVRRALRAACLWDDVAARPDGMAAMVEADAANLSGGQRRRLMLARALAGEPDVLILDETLDAVDRATEERILDNLRRLGITTILVSHRRESLAACDHAWQLVDGRCLPWSAAAQSAHTPPAAAPLPPPAPPPAPIGDAEWAALAVAGRALGVALPAQPSPAPCPATQRPLAWQARRHGLFLLPVSLQSRTWHRRGGGVLLARRDGEPVVLAPAPLGGLRLWDGRGGWRRLDAQTARRLDDRADMLCRRPDPHLRPAAWAGDDWAALLGAAALWLGLPLLAAPAGGAAAAAVILGIAAGRLAARRAAARRGLAATVVLMAHALRLSPRWLHAQGVERVTRWLDDAAERLTGGAATAIGLAATGAAMLLSGHAVAAIGPAAVAASLALWQARLARHAREPAHHAGEFLLNVVLLAPSALGTPLADAVRRRWDALDDAAARREERVRRLSALHALWQALLPPAALAVGAHFLSLSALPALLVAVLAGDHFGRHLAGAVRHAQRAAATRALANAPREDAGALSASPPRVLAAHRVGFAYDRPVLRNASLTIAPGEVIAIAGPSGSGKSTLLRLLMGLDQPQHGRILADGVDLRGLDRLAWRAHVAAVLQDEPLDFRSIAGHVRGRAAIGLDEVAGWLASVGLWPKVAALPMGVASLVETRFLSSGQAALLMVARALARRPAMLFLDETLSPLDPAARATVLAAIRASGVTCVFTSHQEDLLACADRIIRIDHGELREEGGRSAPPTSEPAAAMAPPPAAFGAAGKLYRPKVLARMESPDREDVLPELAAAPLIPALAALAAALLAGGL